MLQEWTLKKRLERAIKVYLYRNDADGISAMQPLDYQKRFLRRCVMDVFEGLDDEQRLGASFVSGHTVGTLDGHSAHASYGGNNY